MLSENNLQLAIKCMEDIIDEISSYKGVENVDANDIDRTICSLRSCHPREIEEIFHAAIELFKPEDEHDDDIPIHLLLKRHNDTKTFVYTSDRVYEVCYKFEIPLFVITMIHVKVLIKKYNRKIDTIFNVLPILSTAEERVCRKFCKLHSKQQCVLWDRRR